MNGDEQKSKAQKHKIVFQQAIEELLQTVAPEMANAIYVGSIPHWADRTLLRRLVKEEVDLTDLLDTLVHFQFARLDSQMHLLYRDEIREILLAWIRQNAPKEYLTATRIALTYFKELAEAATTTERPALEREILYHLLTLDEASGLSQLNEKLEEAFYFRQLGEAETLIEQATQLRDQLSPDGQLWLSYFDACLDLVERKNGNGEETFKEIIKHTSSHVLEALARWKLGQVLVGQRFWSEAIKLYRISIKTLMSTGQTIYRARVLISLGNAYYDLADKSGGLISGPDQNDEVVSRLLNFVLNFPFRIIEWLVRRVSLIPSVYFGHNYQDWIIAYLLYRAAHWFRQAEQLFSATNNPLELAEARLSLAQVEHQMGGWSRARQRYAVLEETAVINQSRYRMAKVRLGQGRADLDEGNLSRAISGLIEANEIFYSFQDIANASLTDFLLGQAYESLQKPVDAAEAFLKCSDTFQVVGDNLTQTRVIWRLERLIKHFQLPAELQTKIESLFSHVTERQSITRFPEGIFRLYRKLALLLAFPLSYGLTAVIGLLGVILLVIAVENGMMQFSNRGNVDLFLTLANLFWLIILILAAFWMGRGIYSIAGLSAVQILGHRLALIEQEQPIYLKHNDEGIECYSSATPAQDYEHTESIAQASIQLVQKLPWYDVTHFLSVDYMILRRPIYLISRSLLRANSQILLVEGMTAGYESFKSEIQKTLADHSPAAKIKNYDFNFVGDWATLMVIAFSLVTTIFLFFIGQIEVSIGEIGSEFTLPISTVFTFTILNLIPTMLAVTLWRLWIHRIHIEKEIGYLDTVVPTWLLLATALLTTLLAMGWIFIQVFLP